MFNSVLRMKDAGSRWAQRMLHRLRDDLGQTAAEYLGIVVVVGAIITAVVGSGVDTSIRNGITTKINEIVATQPGADQTGTTDPAPAQQVPGVQPPANPGPGG